MGNHAHQRPPKEPRTVVRPKTFVRTVPGTILPAIPIPRVGPLWFFRCTCDRFFWTRKRYERHYVLGHVYQEVLR